MQGALYNNCYIKLEEVVRLLHKSLQLIFSSIYSSPMQQYDNQNFPLNSTIVHCMEYRCSVSSIRVVDTKRYQFWSEWIFKAVTY